MPVTTTDNMTNDFGFTFVDEEEVAKTSNTVVTTLATADDYKNRLDKVMKLVLPFLKNLQANPQQAYVKWPDRAKKVAEFQNKVVAISEGRLT